MVERLFALTIRVVDRGSLPAEEEEEEEEGGCEGKRVWTPPPPPPPPPLPEVFSCPACPSAPIFKEVKEGDKPPKLSSVLSKERTCRRRWIWYHSEEVLGYCLWTTPLKDQ